MLSITEVPPCLDMDADGVCDDEDGCVGEFDECGVCNGDGISDGACDCDGNVADCAGECGGSAVVDECGECEGDGTSCADTIDVSYSTSTDVAGFQFDVTGIGSVASASGGAAAAADFQVTVSPDGSTVIGFSFVGATIPAGDGVLTEMVWVGNPALVCITNVILSDANADLISAEASCTLGAILIAETTAPCADADVDGVCDDVDDCVGEFDECGVCNGGGIADGACDCDGNVADCAGECGGSAVVDACGVCNGDGQCGGGDGPGWVFNDSDWEFDATISGAMALDLRIDGSDEYIMQYGEGDLIGAFDGNGVCRGIGVPLAVPFGPYAGEFVFELQVRSNSNAGDVLTFRYYDASADAELVGWRMAPYNESGEVANEYEYTFVNNDNVGSVVAPEFMGFVERVQEIGLNSGWNWFSVNVDLDDGMTMEWLLSSLENPTAGDFIKGQVGTATFYEGYGWYGSFTNGNPPPQLPAYNMYKLKLASEDSLLVGGAAADASETIPLGPGWNWIGYLPGEGMDLSAALDGLTPSPVYGDQIKSPNGSAVFYGSYGWFGALSDIGMAPGQGYMLKLDWEAGVSGQLTYE